MARRRAGLISALLIMDMLIFLSGSSLAQDSGEEIFAKICKACHTIGQGKLVGPDLAGVSHRRSPEWIIPFVQSSQSVIKSGDAAAVALFEENAKLIMPDNPLSRSEVLSVITYIEKTAGDPSSAGEPAPTPLETATEQDLAKGAALFGGLERLTSGGPACNSCHNVNFSGVHGGGVLGKDLTKVASRMSGTGVQAILSSPPFPIMQQAYQGHPLQEDEIFALTAFLEKLTADDVAEDPGPYGQQVFFGGLGGMVLLLAMFSLIWRQRKKAKVYEAIHGRQLNSQ